MPAIRILSDILVNQIAAGEVIERPASIVKELIENSIDANANSITIEISKGGLEKIVVTDDGMGMDEMDARLAFERHATSKIASMDDLLKIKSLGFRGEALASIASVSSIILQTKTQQALSGIRLEMEGGKNPVVTPVGCSMGTKLEINNLFYNTPARKKFLKSESTEYRHILEIVQDLALSHPEISFRFVSNGRTLFDLLKTEKLLPRLGALFGKSISEEMVEVFYGGRDLQITGYIGKPHTARTTRKYQYFMVNGRAVSDIRLGYAVKEAYSNTIPSSQYPIFVLNITIDPQKVDVNVHPRKLEIRFMDPGEIFRVVKGSVYSAIEAMRSSKMGSLTPNIPLRNPNDFDQPAFLRKSSIQPVTKPNLRFEEPGETYDPRQAFSPQANFFGNSVPLPLTSVAGLFSSSSGNHPSTSSVSGLEARKAYLLQKRAERLAAQGKNVDPPFGHSLGASPSFRPHGDESLANFSDSPVATFTQSYLEKRSPGNIRPLAQILNSYILAEDEDGLVIIDQHAAHERVMLGKIRSNEQEREPGKQALLTPVQLELDYREKAILEENLELLHSLGFEISAFGGNTYLVEAIPDFLVKENIEDVMNGFIDDLLSEQAPEEAARRHEHLLHTLACRAAAKFGQRLSSYEQEALIRSLQETEGSCSCAHGRPTMIRITKEELEKKFKRR